ncbi:MAG TPA: hypothetical protein VFH63_07695 [candidate division Zixibacteria bacterium]|nr:hypothetical protein [candidate division Zixibacteria bacterium]
MALRLVARPAISFLAAVALTLAALTAPVVVMGATPNWEMSVAARPDRVSPAATIEFEVSITNHGPSNVAQLYLASETWSGATFKDTSIPGCNPAVAQGCSLGALSAGATVTVLVRYEAPEADGAFTVIFEANTTGATPSDGGSSHGDALVGVGTATVVDDPDFTGGLSEEDLLTFATNLEVGGGNRLGTAVHAPAVGIPVTVEDGPGIQANCAAAPRPCLGEGSELHVAEGATFPGGFTATIRIDSSLLPSGVNHKNIGLIHELDDGSTEILDRCETAKKSSEPESIPCFSVKKLKGNDLEITVFLVQNGRIQGW